MKIARIELHNGFSLSVSDRQLPLTIGRSSNCDIRVSEASISRQHCELYMDEGRALCLKDISANGTVVDHRTLHGESIWISQRTEVQFTDHIGITVTPTDADGITLVP